MMNRLKCVIKKDIKECLRTGKIILFPALSVGIMFMILGFTAFLTDLPDYLTAELPGFDIESLESMMKVIYPKVVRPNIGVYAYYIGVFYSLVTIIVTHNILPKEIEKGKWILPIQKGYWVKEFIIGKCLTYGSLGGLSVFLSYMFYYGVANTFMERNMTFGNAFMCGLIHGINIFFVLAYTILLSVCFKHSIIGAISMIASVMFVPDLLNYFEFAKYLPTYSLNFVYDSRDDYINAFIPIIFNLFLLVMTYIIAVMRVEKRITK